MHGTINIKLLHEVQEKCPQMQTASPDPFIGRQWTLHTTSSYLESIPQYKKQLTYKCFVNNNAENVKAPTTLFSLKYTQNWLKVRCYISQPLGIAYSNI